MNAVSTPEWSIARDSTPDQPSSPLLGRDEPPAVTVLRPEAASDFVLVCDHASQRLPRALGTLGLNDTELDSHMAWDIGAGSLAHLLAERLDATLVVQNYSRLAIDCNRPLTAPDSIARRGEWNEIKGNLNLRSADIETRITEIFSPYHEALGACLDQRQRARRRTLLVAVHSFVPTLRGDERPWHIGVMYNRDDRLAAAVLKQLRRDERLRVGDNEPYAMGDENDYTLPLHGEGRGILHVGLEIRQDLIADESGQKSWAGRLASLLNRATADLSDG